MGVFFDGGGANAVARKENMQCDVEDLRRYATQVGPESFNCRRGQSLRPFGPGSFNRRAGHCRALHSFHSPPAGRFALRASAHCAPASLRCPLHKGGLTAVPRIGWPLPHGDQSQTPNNPPPSSPHSHPAKRGPQRRRGAVARPTEGRASTVPCRGRAHKQAACGREGTLPRKPRLLSVPLLARTHRPASAGRCGRAYPVCAIMYFESVHTFAEDHSSFCAHMHRQEEYQHVWQGNEPLLLRQERSGGL